MARRQSVTAAPNQVKGGPVVPRAMPFDVVIRGGRVLDGTGAPWRRADIGTRGAKVARVGDVGRSKSAVVIDASGKYVAPGFIDIHTHSDIGILVEPTAECAVRQGVTTHVIGNCGDSPAPISERYRELAVRRFEYYAEAKDWNWSTYGEYLELIAKSGIGIEIGEQAGCPVQISHNNPKYGGIGKAKEVQALWEAARARGVEVLADNDVHTDFGPPLSHALPQWTQKLSTEELLGVLRDHTKRDALRAEIQEDKRPGAGYVGLLVHEKFDRIWLLRCPEDSSKEGKTIAGLAKQRGVDPWTAYFDTIVEERDRAVGLFDYMDPEEIKSTLRHPLVMICSDGWVAPTEERTSPTAPYQPCTYGEFPGVIERFVVNENVLRLEEAIHKMTALPASRLGLVDRGLVRPGFRADLVVFDLPRVRDRATNRWPRTYPFENYPHGYPEGIDWVLVNGAIAVEDGRPTGALAGQCLRP